MVADKSLTAEIEAVTERERSRLIAWLAEHQVSTGSTIDREMTADALMVDFIAPRLAEIAALQSRAFEDGAQWMRERSAETAYAMPSQILFFWARPGGPPGNGYRPLDGSHVAQAIRALPLQPEGGRNA